MFTFDYVDWNFFKVILTENSLIKVGRKSLVKLKNKSWPMNILL